MGFLCQREINDDHVVCARPSVCAVGIAIFPPKAFLDHYNSVKPLTRLIITLYLCDEHMTECEREGAFVLLPRDRLEPIARAVMKASFTAVDLDATKVVRIDLDDPDLKILERKSRNKGK